MNAQNNNQTSCAKLPITIIPPRYKVNNIYFTILFSVYLAITLIDVLFSNIILNLLPLILGSFALMLLSTRSRREYVRIYIFVGCLATFFLISSLIVGRTGNRVYMPILFIVSSAGIAMILIRGYVYSLGGYIAFYGLAVYFLMLMLAGVDTSVMGGRNAISIAVLIACITLYIILSGENKKLDLKPALVTLFISIWSVGRSGIASSVVLLLGLLFVRFRAKIYILSMIIYMIIYLINPYQFQDALFEFIMEHSFFANPYYYYLKNKINIVNMQRWIFWSHYFNNLDIFRLIFGFNLLEDPSFVGPGFDLNYHNSFIHLHLQTGFMGLITMALILFALYKYYKTNIVFFFLMLSFILRASTDLFIFFNHADFILFFFIFYLLRNFGLRVPYISPLLAGSREMRSYPDRR